MSNTIITAPQIQWLYEECKRCARDMTVTSYENVANELGLDLSDVDDRVHKLGKALDDVNKIERKRDIDAPMISAVVVHKSSTRFGDERTRMAGDGFFTLAKEWGKQPKGMPDFDFYREELNRVFEYWRHR